MNNTEKKDFTCLLCRHRGGYEVTGKHPRDRKEADIVICPNCGHVQMFPLLPPEEEKAEYDEDKSVREMLGNDDFEAMRTKFSEWTKAHVEMYWAQLQKHKNVLNLGSGYGFFEEGCNLRDNRKFNIEGVEIGKYRLDRWVGGIVHELNFYKDPIPDGMRGRYDMVLCMHLLEHLTDPAAYLEKIKPVMAENAKVVFEVPNLNCFLAEISPEYHDFMYLYEHVSYYTHDTMKKVFELAGYTVDKVYSREIYSIENHIRWVREGTPFKKYNQMYIPDKLEFINEIYKTKVAEMDKGFSLIIEARPQK